MERGAWRTTVYGVAEESETTEGLEPVPAADRETQRLRAGEEIIVTARDLYDGKVVR